MCPSCRHLTKDITLYYQLRLRCCQDPGEDEGQVVLDARTWPGSPVADPNDLWRGLRPNTMYNRVFRTIPGRLDDPSVSIPAQAHPLHVLQDQEAYVQSTSAQVEAIEKYMKKRPAYFTPVHRNSMSRLLGALTSNLQDQVGFDWSPESIQEVYGTGQYEGQKRTSPDQPVENEFIREIEDAAEQIPDGMADPQGLQDAIDRGEVSQADVQNVQACVLKKNNFYLMRPHPDDAAPFLVVRVMRAVPDPDNPDRQWGGWVQHWQNSVAVSEQRDYFTDPYHAIEPTGKQFNRVAGDFGEQRWPYTLVPLRSFQDNVNMTRKWSKPKDWTKKFTGSDGNPTSIAPHGVERKAIAKATRTVIRNHLLAWKRHDREA